MTAYGTPSGHGDHAEGREPSGRSAANRGAPHVTEMSEAECRALLLRHQVGRMAYSLNDRVDITPIHYVYSDGWLFARTSHGGKMDILAVAPYVAFEVDEVEGVFDWRSVVVHGTVYRMERDGSPHDAANWARGIELLRAIVPETGTDDDPVPYRSLVFGIYVHSLTGRRSSR